MGRELSRSPVQNGPHRSTPTVQTSRKAIAVRGHTVPVAQVVIVGSGLAGLCAGLEAASAGAIVVLLEKEPRVGGNSAKATSGINGVNTTPQTNQGIEDSDDLFRRDSIKSGGGMSDECLIDTLVAYAKDAVEWLQDSFELDLSSICQCGGHSKPRTHRIPPSADGRPVPVGWTTVSTLRKYLEAKENVTIVTGATVTRLLTQDTAHSKHGDLEVVGVDYEVDGAEKESKSILADAVILATGGYAFERGDGSLLKEFASEQVWSLPTTSGKQADGAGINLARRDVGAHLTHMDQVQIHPTGLVDPNNPGDLSKMLAPEAMRGSGGILLNSHGRRFCDELDTRAAVTAAILESCETGAGSDFKQAFLVLNEEASAAFGVAPLAFYASKGLVKSVKGSAGLAELIGCPEEHVESALAKYDEAAHATNGSDDAGEPMRDEHSKSVFPSKEWKQDQDFYVAMVTPCIHYTMGGLSISSSAEVLRLREEDGVLAAVLGLFAAGEVTGGVHGANRLAGNSLLECVIFGRIAGRRASQITQDLLPALDPNNYTPVRMRHRKCVSEKGFIYELSFELPSPRHTVFPGMLSGQYVSIRSELNGKSVERFYSPITRDKYFGKVDLLVKASPQSGEMQAYLYSMQPGTVLEMKGPMGGLDFSLDDPEIKKVGMIAGGVGISPMVQIVRQILYEDLEVEAHLMWGVEYEEDIVYRGIMDERAKAYDNLQVTYVINHPPEGWEGETGFVSKDVLERNMFPPEEGVKIVVCGPWKMCQVMKATLKDMGYTDKMVFSFM